MAKKKTAKDTMEEPLERQLWKADDKLRKDRRPLKTRSWRIFQTLAAKLATAGVTPNGISIASVVFIGEPLHWTGDKSDFLERLCQSFDQLEAEANKPAFIDEV